MKKYIPAIICTLAVLLWIGFIWSNSMKTGEESGETSAQVVEIINETTSQMGIEEPVSEHTVRKGAHFSEYMVLGFLISLDVFLLLRCRKNVGLDKKALTLLISVPTSASVALFDEFIIQKNTIDRGPSLCDVIIDTSGAMTALVCVLFVFMLSTLFSKGKRIKNKK